MYLLYNKKPSYTSCVKLSVPLLIRLLEYAQESEAGDVDLHWITERVIEHGDSGKVLTMEHYTELVPEHRLITVEVKAGEKIEVEKINE